MNRFVVLSFAVAALSACGKKAPLTQEQKQVLGSTLGSGFAGMNAAVKDYKAGQPGAQATDMSPLAFLGLENVEAAIAANPGYTTVEDAFANDHCVYSANNIDRMPNLQAGMPTNLNMSFSASGAQCPVTIDLSLQGSANGNSNSGRGSFAFRLAYTVTDARLLPIVDVDQMDMSMNVDISGDQSGGSIRGNLGGKIHSQSQGDIGVSGGIDASGNQSGGSGSATLALAFPTFVAEFKVEGNSNGQAKLTLNGEEITKADLERIIGGHLGDSSADQSGSVSNPGNPSIPGIRH